MKRALAFAKRNFIELKRDLVAWIFCAAVPAVMLGLFCLINGFTQGNTPMFSLPALVPGIICFSFSFVMLQGALTLSKDRTTSLLTRLFSSPMKSWEFLFGYFLPLFVVGVAQEVICLAVGYLLSIITGQEYFSLLQGGLLCLQMLPMLMIYLSLGVAFGCFFQEKSAPGICSVLISAGGMLSGAWMPLEAMGGFERVCSLLPFWQSVRVGRVITGAVNSFGSVYTFEGIWQFVVIITLFLLLSIGMALFAFHKRRNPK